MGTPLGHACFAAASLGERRRESEHALSSGPFTSELRRPPAPGEGSLPRLLAGVPEHGAMPYDEHVALHGPVPIMTRRGRRQATLIDELERAGLRGRGGAGFPAAAKMRAVSAAGRRPVIVVNAVEAEPASGKDVTLMHTLPHLALDGAQLAAHALGAEEVVVCISEAAPAAYESAGLALAERAHVREPAGVRLAAVPRRYVAGQETALVSYLNGGPALPTFTPPMPYERGVGRRPTLVNNAETLAHVALIARHGARWFRSLGTHSQPGSALVTLLGPVPDPGVYEISYGSPLSSLVAAAGGVRGGLRGALVGGYAGTWIAGALLGGISLSDEHLAPHGATVGAGVVVLLGDAACPVAETARVAGWLSEQGAGQCGPCVNGLQALASSVAEIAAGAADRQAAQRIARLSSLVSGRGACRHPDGAVQFIGSALEAFAAEFADHARHGACELCHNPPQLPLLPRA